MQSVRPGVGQCGQVCVCVRLVKGSVLVRAQLDNLRADNDNGMSTRMPGKRKADVDGHGASGRRVASKGSDDSDTWFDEYKCPITQELPVDPVMAEDGRVYERSAITDWLRTKKKSPHTNESMGSKLIPAMQVKNLISSMVRSGAISGDKAGAWTKKLEGEKEVEEMRQKAEAGDAEAMMSLADWYQDGTNGLQKNLSERYKWAKRAADLDHAEGISDVGWCAFFGEGTEQNRALGNVLCCQGQYTEAREQHEARTLRSTRSREELDP